MYFADLSPYRYEFGLGEAIEERGITPLCIGWLSKDKAYPEGSISVEFRERFLKYCRRARLMTIMMGFHVCEFCRKARGNGEIWVTSGRKIYIAPALVLHYVLDHRYCPPSEFQEAVLRAPLPNVPPTLTRSHGESSAFCRCPSCNHLVKIEGLPFTGTQQSSCDRCGELLRVTRVDSTETATSDEYRIEAV